MAHSRKIQFDPSVLGKYIDDDGRFDARDAHIETWEKHPVFAPVPRNKIQTVQERRESVQRKVKTYLNLPFVDLWNLKYNLDRAIASSPFNAACGDMSFMTVLGVHCWLATGSITSYGNDAQIARWMPSCRNYDTPGCFCMTEVDHGSNVRSLQTEARYDTATHEYVIHTPNQGARKIWIGNAGYARFTIVFAKLLLNDEDHGIHAFYVPMRDEKGTLLQGVHYEDCGEKQGLNGVANGIVSFDHVRIPADHCLDRYGGVKLHPVSGKAQYVSPIPNKSRRFNAMLGALFFTRLALTAAGIGAIKMGLAIAIRYSMQRTQFGPPGQAELPIMHFSTHKLRLMPPLAFSFGLHVTWKYIKDRYANMTPETEREVQTLISGFKALGTWESISGLQLCRECCGGQGYLTANVIAQLRSDLDIFVTLEGDNTVLAQLVGNFLLTQFRKEMAAGNFSGMLSFITNQVIAYLGYPLTKRRTDREHLLDPSWHKSIFEQRQVVLLNNTALRLRHKINYFKQKKMAESVSAKEASAYASFEGWNACLPDVMALANSHLERIILEQFNKAVEEAPDSGCRDILRLLCNIYALDRISKNAAWFLEHGFIDSYKSERIRRVLLDLCNHASDNALELVESFGMPKNVISVPCLNEFASRM